MSAIALTNVEISALSFGNRAQRDHVSSSKRKDPKGQKSVSSYVNGNAPQTAAALLWEKNLLAPELKALFNAVSINIGFDKSSQRVVNIGCGAAHDSIPLLRDGIIIDGIDRSTSMLRIAEENINSDEEITEYTKKKIRLVPSFSELQDQSYAIALMDFVHQGANSIEELGTLFFNASRIIQKSGYLIVVGEHPDHLNKKHSLYKCLTAIDSPLKDGDRYNSSIINPSTKEQHHFAGSASYWSTSTLDRVAGQNDLVLANKKDIHDPHICTRGTDGFPGYQALIFRKI